MNIFKAKKLIKIVAIVLAIPVILCLLYFPFFLLLVEDITYGMNKEYPREEDERVLKEYIATRPYKDLIAEEIEEIKLSDGKWECYTPLNNRCREVLFYVSISDYDKVERMIEEERKKRIKKHFITSSPLDRFQGRTVYEEIYGEDDEDKDGLAHVIIFID